MRWPAFAERKFFDEKYKIINSIEKLELLKIKKRMGVGFIPRYMHILGPGVIDGDNVEVKCQEENRWKLQGGKPQRRGAKRKDYLKPKSLFSKIPTKGVIIKK